MYLMYADESGNTGTDLDDKSQPVFVLAGIVVKDENWHKVNDKFEQEKIKIYPEFKEKEIHASELFNAPKRSVFNKYSWKDNLIALEKIVDLIISLEVTLFFTCIHKNEFKKHVLSEFGENIKIDPYLYAFATCYDTFNESLENNLGIIFTDDIRNISNSLELLYPKLVKNRKNIIEKSFYLDSRKNNFIQMADICALYLNKYICIRDNYCRYNSLKEEHCIKMFEKISKLLDNGEIKQMDIQKSNMLDKLFK